MQFHYLVCICHLRLRSSHDFRSACFKNISKHPFNIWVLLKELNVQEIETEVYPDHCTGNLWITSPGTAGQIAKAAQVVKFFWIDDVWITGYIAKLKNIEHQVNIWSGDKIEIH